MHGSTTTAHNAGFQPQTQAAGLLSQHRSLATLGQDIVAAARVAAAVHMAESAAPAQNTRDQASRLRDLIASMSTQGVEGGRA